MKYSIDELDYMRRLISDIMVGPIENGRGYRTPDDERVESKLRTHMINGTTVEELQDHADKVRGYALRPYVEPIA